MSHAILILIHLLFRWHISVVDIEGTLGEVTRKVFNDHSISSSARLKRAEAVGVMATLFMRAALAKGGSKDPRLKVAQVKISRYPLFPDVTHPVMPRYHRRLFSSRWSQRCIL